MSKITTDYGLVYNTDGSLCVTKRTDEVPFPGVTSFAVETGTTNLVQNPQFLNDTLIVGFIWRIDLPSTEVKKVSVPLPYNYNNWGGTGYIEVVNNIMNMHNESSTVNLALMQDFTIDNTKEHTISCRVRSANGQDCPIDVYFGAGYYNIGTAPASGAWVTLERTYVPSELAASSTMHFKIPSGKYLQIDWLQFEQKPFASSFVVGSRPKGRLVIPVEDLKFDIANDDWVISCWKYPVATRDDSLNNTNLCSLGRYTSDYSKGYICWGITSMNKYYLLVALNDATGMRIYSDNTFNPTDYFYHWHYEVVKKSGKVLSYYVDGVKQCEATIPADKELQTPFDVGLGLGTTSGTMPNNALIAAPYYGYNSATWTD